ncbi:IS4/Tn5 family transposase DNA-binding protein [Methylobacter svalbardensis]
MNWANREFRNLDLGDKRLKNRAINSMFKFLSLEIQPENG